MSATPMQAKSIGRLDERDFGFFLNVPDDWSADIDAEDGPILSWRLQQKDWLAGSTHSGLVSLSVSVLEPDVGQDTAKVFRSFVGKYGEKFLEKAEVRSFEPFRFGQFSGFDARVAGGIKRPSGKIVPVVARIFIYLTADREVIVSAVAPKAQADLLDSLGQPGTLFEASTTAAETSVQANDGAQTPAAPAPAAVNTEPVLVLPDNSSRFRTFAWGGGVLEEFGSLGSDGLKIKMAADAATGGAGIASTGTMINLGDLEAGAATTIRLSFDPDQSNNALIILCPGQHTPCLSDQSFHIALQPGESGTALSLAYEGNPLARTVLMDGMPSYLSIRIDRDGIYAFPSNGEALSVERPHALAPFSGLELVAAAVPLPSGSTLFLKSVAVQSTQGNLTAAALPEPEAERSVFPAGDPTIWKEVAVSGGDFASMAKLENGRLDVRVLPGNQWGHTGLISGQPVFRIPEDGGDVAPARLHGNVDPSQNTLSFAVSLLPDPASDLWLNSVAYVQFSRNEDGTFRARLNVCASPTRVVEMTIEPAWSGNFDLLVSPQRIELVAERHRVGTVLTCGLKDMKGHVAIFAAPPRENDPAALSLTGLAVDRLPYPDDGLSDDGSAADDSAFDPALWISAVSADLIETGEGK